MTILPPTTPPEPAKPKRNCEARRTPTIKRVLKKTEWDGECCLWTGSLQPNGYGAIYDYGQDGNPRKSMVHRVVYEAFVGPIPDGLHIDHLCRVRNCINPAHLEPVTPAENNRRAVEAAPRKQSACFRGHPLAAGNLLRNSTARTCRTCQNARAKAQRSGMTFDEALDWVGDRFLRLVDERGAA